MHIFPWTSCGRLTHYIRLQGQDLPQTHTPQGHPVQEGQGLYLRARKASLRSQTIRLWWSDQARLPQEGEDDKEGRIKIGVHSVQIQDAAPDQALQALRAWWRQKDEGCRLDIRESHGACLLAWVLMMCRSVISPLICSLRIYIITPALYTCTRMRTQSLMHMTNMHS